MARIQGDRIVLREFWQEDLEDIHSWACDPRTAAMLGEVFIRPRTREQTQEYLDNLLEGGSGANFVIADGDSLNYLGQCSLMMVDGIARKAELSMVLREECTGQGFGYEAGQLVIRFAFFHLNLRRLWLKVLAENARAIRLYKKLGFRVEGRLREDSFRAGYYEDVLVMGLLRQEWHEEGGDT